MTDGGQGCFQGTGSGSRGMYSIRGIIIESTQIVPWVSTKGMGEDDAGITSDMLFDNPERDL